MRRVNSARQLLKRHLPQPIMDWYRERGTWQPVVQEGADSRSAEEIFTEVYEQNLWGGDGFYSGSGSYDIEWLRSYLRVVIAFLQTKDAKNLTLVDLGCGDFSVG